MNDRVLTTRAVAEYLGSSPETVLRRYRAGDLPGIRFAQAGERLSCRKPAWLSYRGAEIRTRDL